MAASRPALFGLEDHDEALYTWRAREYRGRSLVHVDAHHDVWHAGPHAPITIANYLSPALREGILREIRWVVPDGAWQTRATRAALLEKLRSLLRSWGEPPQSYRWEGETISASLGGYRFEVCSLAALDPPSEPVLLDLDVDFLVIRDVARDGPDHYATLPWIWPEELIARLRGRGLEWDCSTIAYSVQGGYTPLRWRYLGDELHGCLAGRDGAAAGFAQLRRGHEALAAGQADSAATHFKSAHGLLPASAAGAYNLALLAAARGDDTAAARWWRTATEREPVYAGAYRTRGLPLLWQKRWREAEAEFECALRLDPADPVACAGLGDVARRRGDLRAARQWYDRALAVQPENVAAWRGLARTRARQGEHRAAIAAWREALRLGLHGGCAPSPAVACAAAEVRLRDAEHGPSYAELARLYQAMHEWRQAVAAWRMALAAGLEGPGLRARLAACEWRSGCRRSALREAGAALRRVAPSARRLVRLGWRRLRRGARRAAEAGLA